MTDTHLTQARKLLEGGGGGTTAAAAPLLDDNLSKEEVSQRIADSEGERATGHLHRKDLKAGDKTFFLKIIPTVARSTGIID